MPELQIMDCSNQQDIQIDELHGYDWIYVTVLLE